MGFDPSRRRELEEVLLPSGTISFPGILLLVVLCGVIAVSSAIPVPRSAQRVASEAPMQRTQQVAFFGKQKQNSSCPDGWRQGPFGSRCFMFFNVSSSWEDSESSCKNKGGRLASVSTQAELVFVQTVCGGVCWLGGRGSSRGSKWSDCSVWNSSLQVENSSSGCTGPACSPISDKYCVMVSSAPSLMYETCMNGHPYVCVLMRGDKCRQAGNRKEYLIILVAVSCLILTTTLGIVIWLLIFKRKKRRRRGSRARETPEFGLKLFTLDDLRVATNNFGLENRLRIGSTFRALLPDGSLVAVKKLERPVFQAKRDFLAEMTRISRLRHPNIVGILGCCYQDGERFIVYEYVVNGPLDQWLHDPVRRGTLDWRARMRIAISAAQGIAYLHDQVKPNVIHRDVKASSLLLDDDFNARLMGVGLASFVPWEAVYERTVVAGTHGYLAPEFVYRNELTTKSDVYSFGVLLLELISGRKPAMPVDVVEWQTIFEWATPLVQSQRYTELVDPLLTTIPSVAQIQKLIDLVYSCTQHVPSMRPRMSYVVHQLQQVDIDDVQQRQEVVHSVASSSNEPAQISAQLEIIESLF